MPPAVFFLKNLELWYKYQNLRYFVGFKINFSFLVIFAESNSLQKPVEVVVEDEDESSANDAKEGYCVPTIARNVQWGWTSPGETAILPCPLGNFINHCCVLPLNGNSLENLVGASTHRQFDRKIVHVNFSTIEIFTARN